MKFALAIVLFAALMAWNFSHASGNGLPNWLVALNTWSSQWESFTPPRSFGRVLNGLYGLFGFYGLLLGPGVIIAIYQRNQKGSK